MKMDTQSRRIRIHRKDIAYFKFIIESYEGLALLRTLDSREAVVELMVAPGWETDIDEILKSLSQEITLEIDNAECEVRISEFERQTHNDSG